MTEIYNLTNVTTSSNVWTVTKNTNELVGGSLAYSFLIIVFLIVFAKVSSRLGAQKGFLVASFVNLMATVFLFVTEIVSVAVLGVGISLFALALIINIIKIE